MRVFLEGSLDFLGKPDLKQERCDKVQEPGEQNANPADEHEESQVIEHVGGKASGIHAKCVDLPR